MAVEKERVEHVKAYNWYNFPKCWFLVSCRVPLYTHVVCCVVVRLEGCFDKCDLFELIWIGVLLFVIINVFCHLPDLNNTHHQPVSLA